MSKVVERFMRYVKDDTTSSLDSKTTPSTDTQKEFAKELAKEMQQIGLSNVTVDEKAYIMAELPSNIDKKVPVVGFISHLDTAPEMTGKNVNPVVIENYDGNDIILNEELKVVLSPADFPELKEYIGKDIITTDGTTLLGADDKAGVAEILTAAEYLINNPDIPHGTIKIAITPDEEIGAGADYFDVKRFAADLAYTVDGGKIGELEYENFNAAVALVYIKGKNVHPGTAKNQMINAALVANEFISLLPQSETPSHTEGYEGFYHLLSIKGEVEEAVMRVYIRDFDRNQLEVRKSFVTSIASFLNGKYGDNTVKVELKDQYYNMKEKIEPVKYIVDTAITAMKAEGVEPVIQPIRGGTDGARLSFMGLPTPNIFTGGHNFHGKYEYIPTFAMEKSVKVILKIIDLYSK